MESDSIVNFTAAGGDAPAEVAVPAAPEAPVEEEEEQESSGGRYC